MCKIREKLVKPLTYYNNSGSYSLGQISGNSSEYKITSNVISNPSTIKAYGNIVINSENTVNKNSNIYGNDISINTNNLINYVTQFVVTTYSRYNERGRFCGGKCNMDTIYRKNNILYSKTPSKIIAKGNLTVSPNAGADAEFNNGTQIEDPNIDLGGSSIDYSKKEIENSQLDDILKNGTLNPLNNTSLPQGKYGIFSKSENPNSNYLYETDPLLVDVSKFLGSFYFLNRLGIDPNSMEQKFLGDAYFDNEMIKKSLENETLQNMYDKASNNGETEKTTQERIDEMYENVDKDLQENLGLVVGQKLTEEQLKKLDKDIVWYVSQDIDLGNGQIIKGVLVPQVFLSKSHRNLLNDMNNKGELDGIGSGSMIAGNNVVINTKRDLNNSGNSAIVAKSNLIIRAGNDINNINGGVIKNLNNTYTTTEPTTGNVIVQDSIFQLIAGNDINNIGSTIEANTAGTALIYAENDVNNETTKIRLKVIGGFKDEIGNSANIISKSGNLTLIANSGDIKNTGANVSANGDIALSAGNDIIFNTLELESYSRIGGYDNSRETKTLINSGSNLTAGGNLVIDSGNDTNIIGSNVEVVGSANIQTGGNLNVESVQDTYHYESHTKKKGSFGSSKKSSTIIDKTTNVASNINVGGDLTTNSDENINILASNVSAGGDIMLQADKNINLISGQNTYSRIDKSSKSGMVSSKMSTSIKENTTQVKSTLTAGGNLTTFSGDDTNIVASDLNSKNGSVSIVAGQYLDSNNEIAINKDANVNIINAYDTNYEFSKTVKSRLRLNDLGNVAKTLLIPGQSGSMSLFALESKSNEAGTLTKTVVSSNINAENGINIQSSGDTTLLASKLKSQNGNIDINAGTVVDKDGNIIKNDSANVIIASANDSVNSYSESSKTKLALEIKKDGIDVATYNNTKNSEIQTTNVASEISTENGDININTQNTIALTGSNINTKNGNIGLNSETGNIIIASGKNYEDSQSSSTSGSIGIGFDKDFSMTTGKFLQIDENHGKSTNVASNITAEGGAININSGNDTIIQASNINGDTGVSLKTKGNTEILAGLDSEWSSHGRKEGTSQLSFESTSSEFSAKAGVRYEQEKKSTDKTKVVGSNIISNSGSVIGDSEDSITIAGSNVIANQNIDLKAKNDLNILSTQEVETNKESFFMIDAGIKAGISGNVFDSLDKMADVTSIDLGGMVEGAINMTTSQAEMLSNMNFDFDESLSGNEEAINGTMKGLEAYQAFNQGPSAKADISVNVEIEGSKHEDTTRNSVGSLLLAGNDIDLKTEKGDINIEGSQIQSGNNTTLDSGNDINIKSSKNTYSSKDSGFNLEVDVSVLGQGFNINGGINNSKSSGTTHNNSTISAGNDFILKSKNNTTVEGANITAKNEVNMDVGNNLKVASEQNTSKSNNFSLNLGVGNSGGGNANVGFQYGYNDRNWVDNQTSIIGNNSVNINVGTKEGSEGNTNIVGALIASGNYEEANNNTGTQGSVLVASNNNSKPIFNDNGNLTLNTKSLTYNDIYDKDKGRQIGLNVGVSKDKSGTDGSLGFNYESHDIRQTTKATIGNGNITTGVQSYTKEIDENGNTVITANGGISEDNSNLAGLNRDVNNSQVITKEPNVKSNIW